MWLHSLWNSAGPVPGCRIVLIDADQWRKKERMEGKTKAEIKAKSQSQSQRRRCHNASQTGTRSRAMKWSQCEELPLVTKWVIRKWGLMRKVRPRMTQIHWDSILKSKDITLPTKVHLVKALVFPAVMYGCESWTVKKAEHQRIDAFELWCWKDSWESLGL